MTYLDDNEEMGEKWVCAIADTLQPGDEVMMNDRSRALTVTDRDTQEGVGDLYPFEQVWLEGNGTEYYLRYSHTHRYHPKLYSASEYDIREQACGRTEVKTHVGSGREVLFIETVDGGETAIVSEQSATEFIEEDISSATWHPDPEQGTVEIDTEGEVLGDCINCEGSVLQDGERAVCQSCGSWCWITQWREWEGIDGK